MKISRIRRKKREKYKIIIMYILIVISLIIFIISTYKIIIHIIDDKRIKEQTSIINNNVNIEEIDNDNVEIIEQDDDLDENNLYWNYIKMNLIEVDFSELKSTNNNVKGWIQVAGTNINYPFVQYSDNKYYLTHSFDNSDNSAGWIFLDYRNNLTDFDDKNTIIYGHGMINQTMFGSLKNILSSGWLNDTNNYVVKLSTEYENTLWQVFSVYRIPTTSDYIRTDFVDNNDYLEFINMLINRSAFNFNTNVSSSDRILTLSTCYNDNDKVVLHAKLIKREIRN